jgi:hypothetical protein
VRIPKHDHCGRSKRYVARYCLATARSTSRFQAPPPQTVKGTFGRRDELDLATGQADRLLEQMVQCETVGGARLAPGAAGEQVTAG